MQIIVVDPVCAQSHGHNLTIMCRFFRLFRQHLKGRQVKCYSAKYLSKSSIPNDVQINASLGFYYHSRIEVPGPDAAVDRCNQNQLSKTCQNIRKQKDAKNDIKMIHEENDLSEEDIVFYPGIDYYSLNALVSYLYEDRPCRTPKYVIRWIGVMEHAADEGGESLTGLLQTLDELELRGVRVEHTAESPNYAAYLSGKIGRGMVVTPPIVEGERLPHSNNSRVCLSFPGAGRVDKGIDRIASIVDALEYSAPNLPVNVDVQLPRPNELRAVFSQIRDLSCHSCVEVQPDAVSDAAILENIRRADIVVLPYSAATYRFRYSAMVAEAACYGRLIVCSEGCGFTEDVRNLELGAVAATDEQFAREVTRIASLPRSVREEWALAASNRYRQYRDAKYETFIQIIMQL